MNINNLNYRPPMTYNEPNKEQESRTMNRNDIWLIIVILEVAILIGIWSVWIYGAVR